MATISRGEQVGFRPVGELDEAWDVWPRGDRPAVLREAAGEFRARFREQGQVTAIRTVDLVSAAYPVAYAFHGAARAVNPYLMILNRLVVVQFDDFEGRARTLVWEPTIPEGSAEAPFYAQLIARMGERVANRFGKVEFNTLPAALDSIGLSPDDVDYLSFDHLHVQDVRMLLGGTDHEPIFPRAKLISLRREFDTLRSIHPTQWAWYVPDGLSGVDEERLVETEGSIELGPGLAFVATPGHTDGNQSLCVNTPEGIWVSSENGVAADSWHPHLSKIPGVRRYAEFYGREVVMNANTLEDSVDQYDSMILEKALADVNRRDPRWHNTFPSSELMPLRRQWPILPTFVYGGINYGRIESPTSA
jgi:hypothetical protein